MSNSLRELIAAGGVFQGYVYGYPHKTAYRRLTRPRQLAEAWATEDKGNISLYVHLPFCEMRCGFCNLFTMARPLNDMLTAYLNALERQSEAVAAALGTSCRFSRLVIGGGTPTFLSTAEIARLFAILNQHLLGSSNGIPKSIEASPATVDSEKAAWLRVPLANDEPVVVVSIHCPSTGRQYLVRVPPTIRTCHQAVAWTAGFDNPADYAPVEET